MTAPYTDVCPICTGAIEGTDSATDHIVSHAGQLKVVHPPCLVTVGKDIFRDTQARLKRMKCGHCTLPLPYHTIGSASTAGAAFVRCSDGQSFEAAA